jgi:hypothetical protein
LTAAADEGLLDYDSEATIKGHLTKPFDVDDLLAILRGEGPGGSGG